MQRLACFLLLFFISSFVRAQDIDVQHYKFEIELSNQSDVINGKATITVKFLNNASQIKFDLASVENDKGMYAFQVKEKNRILTSHHVNNVLAIDLSSIAKKDEVHTFEINYMGTPKDGLIISKNKFGDRTFFADNWPNRAHNWIPCNDRPDDKASFEFIVTAPSEYKIISNGKEVKETMIDQNRKRTHWKEDVPLSTKVMVIGAAKFAVKQFKDSPENIPVSAWVYPQDSVEGFYDYSVAPGIVKFFSNYIAPFPYNKLANVQSKTIFGGMENASCIFYAEESVTVNRKWEAVMAHEIAHQWFGDMASEKSFAHLWLSEGFATYLTDIYIENKYGKDSANKRLQKERAEVAAFVKTNDHPVVDSLSPYMELLNPNSYQKGAWVLHMLRNEVGDSVFHKIIQTYYRQYKGGNADTRDFEAVAEKISEKNLKWFFDEWLYKPGMPKLTIDWKYKTGQSVIANEVVLTIKQPVQNTYRFSLEVQFNYEDGTKEVHTIPVTNSTITAGFPVKKKVVEVVPDPGTKLLFRE